MNSRHTLAAVLLLGTVAPTARAGTCTINSSNSVMIADGAEENGVPNYNQNDFGGPNDCGPNTAAMILGFYDGQDWPCIIEGASLYSGDVTPSAGLYTLQSRLLEELPYSDTTGTWDVGVLPLLNGDIGSDILSAGDDRDANVSGWSSRDDDDVERSTIRYNIRADQPVALMVTWPDPWEDWSWSGDDESGSEGIAGHWMPIIGYKDVTRGRELLGECIDYLAFDSFYVITRSSWRGGGDSQLWYNWMRDDIADFYTVELQPNGTAACSTDELDADGDGYGTTAPLQGQTVGEDCDDSTADISPGATDVCKDGLDNNCDGIVDGYQDVDGDGIGDTCDTCPSVFNSDQSDEDADGLGDQCDPCEDDKVNDPDEDGLCATEDVCPEVYDPDQADLDEDGEGDLCDDDVDGDAVPNYKDVCPTVYDPDQGDLDGDGYGDLCDTCPKDDDPDQTDIDGDGDVCDEDDDGDGVTDVDDNCPQAYNPDQTDLDDDGDGLVCDADEQVAAFNARLEGLVEELVYYEEYLVIEAFSDGSWPLDSTLGCPVCTKPWQGVYEETEVLAYGLVKSAIDADGEIDVYDVVEMITALEPELEAFSVETFTEAGWMK